jgi:ABC-type phosphate/phosphonate transport system substrate-binding protein
MDINDLIDKLKDALYDSKPDEKQKMIKDLNSHHDRIEAYHDHELITAILRTLREVKYEKCFRLAKLLGT